VLSLRCEDVSSSELFCHAYMLVPKMALTDGRYVPSFILRLFPRYFACNRSVVLHGLRPFVCETLAPVQHLYVFFLPFILSFL
jgi:hypothetical protein